MKRAILFILLFASVFAITFNVEHQGNLYVGEDNDYSLYVTNSINNGPVENASVEIYKGSDLLATKLTDNNGTVSFVLHPLNETLLAFRLTRMGYNEYVLFEEAVVRAVTVNETTPTNETTTNSTSAPITGFLTMNPGDQGVFFFLTFFVFISLFAASFLYYKNFSVQSLQEELAEAEGSSWETTNVFDFNFPTIFRSE